MSKQTELLDLFTEEENVRYVLEILQRRNEILGRLMTPFMQEVQSHLQERLPANDKWELVLYKDQRCIVCWDATVAKESQYLRYELRQWVGEGHSQLVLLLGWRDDAIWDNKKVHEPAAVKQLHSHLKVAGFRTWQRWFRFRYISVHDSEEEFLAGILDQEDRSSLLRQLGDHFCPLIKDTDALLVDANAQIAQVVQE